MMAALDEDGDGSITLEEWQARIANAGTVVLLHFPLSF